jgi:hypothetical protein
MTLIWSEKESAYLKSLVCFNIMNIFFPLDIMPHWILCQSYTTEQSKYPNFQMPHQWIFTIIFALIKLFFRLFPFCIGKHLNRGVAATKVAQKSIGTQCFMTSASTRVWPRVAVESVTWWRSLCHYYGCSNSVCTRIMEIVDNERLWV